MDVLGQFLDSRPPAGSAAPEDRLLRFDSWLRGELAQRIDWAWAGPDRERRIEQCRICVEGMVIKLWRRGWMLDGKHLARRIQELLDAVGRYQRADKVKDFWPYFSAAVDRYVGLNSEEIQREAMSAGMHSGRIAADIFGKVGPRPPSLPELVAQRAAEVSQAKEETLRQKTARARARQAACKADAEQPRLPNFR